MTYTEGNLQNPRDKAVNESEKKGLVRKQDVWMSAKEKYPKCELGIRYVKIKQVKKFKYLRNVLTDDRKCERYRYPNMC